MLVVPVSLAESLGVPPVGDPVHDLQVRLVFLGHPQPERLGLEVKRVIEVLELGLFQVRWLVTANRKACRRARPVQRGTVRTTAFTKKLGHGHTRDQYVTGQGWVVVCSWPVSNKTDCAACAPSSRTW